MRLLRLFAIFAVCAMIPLSAHAAGPSGRMLFVAELTAQDFPVPIQTGASGLATIIVNPTMDTMWLNASFHGLISPFAGGHVHVGGRGDQGPTFVDVTYSRLDTNDPFSGTITHVITDTNRLTKSYISLLMQGKFYFNIHSLDHEDGEIRGQFRLEGGQTMTSILTGEQEVPPVSTPAIGYANMHLMRHNKMLIVHAQATGLSSATTMAHFHRGDSGVAGGVMVGLRITGNTIHDTISPEDFDMNEGAYMSFIDSLMDGHVYLNIHTETHKPGEIRGQVRLDTMAGMIFHTMLDGMQEVPPVQTQARGFGHVRLNDRMDTLHYMFVYKDLSSAITMAHFHLGEPGVAGPPVITIPMSAITANRISGMVTAAEMPAGFISDMIRGRIYVNVHTENHQPGEIRGQIMSDAHESYVFTLDSKQEVQAVPVVSAAAGHGYISIAPDMRSAHYMIAAGGFTTPVTMAHFHKGRAGEVGPPIFDIMMGNSVSISDTIFAGMWMNTSSSENGRMPFSEAVVSMIRKDSIYANIHTVAFPQGEIRGQVMSPVIVTSVEEEISEAPSSVIAYPNPTAGLFIMNFESVRHGDAYAFISDLRGNRVLSVPVRINSGANSVQLDLSALAAGSYMIRLESAGNLLLTQKLVKE